MSGPQLQLITLSTSDTVAPWLRHLTDEYQFTSSNPLRPGKDVYPVKQDSGGRLLAIKRVSRVASDPTKQHRLDDGQAVSDDPNWVLMVMPQALCSLEEYLMHFGGRISETQARFIAYCVISGWVEVQQFSATEPLVHRDINPGNILLFRDAEGQLVAQLADFGVSRICTQFDTVTGTPGYWALEIHWNRNTILSGTQAVDTWALGACVFMMLTNQTPVAVMSGKTLTQHHDSLAAFVRKLVKEGVISKKYKQFLLACFTKEPIARPFVSNLLGHDWLKEEVSTGMQSPDAISRAGGKTWAERITPHMQQLAVQAEGFAGLGTSTPFPSSSQQLDGTPLSSPPAAIMPRTGASQLSKADEVPMLNRSSFMES